MLVEEKADGMYQNVPQQTISQMPQITRPDSLHLTTIRQLTENGVNEITNLPQDRTVVGCTLWRVSFAERGLQDDAFGSQKGLQIRKPRVAITQHDACCAFVIFTRFNGVSESET